MTEAQVYWWLKLDAFRSEALALTIMLIFAFGISGLIVSSYTEKGADGDAYVTKYGLALAVSNFIFWSLITLSLQLIPSTKEYALIKVFPKIANSEIAKEVPDDLKDMYSMAKNYMKEKLTTR